MEVNDIVTLQILINSVQDKLVKVCDLDKSLRVILENVMTNKKTGHGDQLKDFCDHKAKQSLCKAEIEDSTKLLASLAARNEVLKNSKDLATKYATRFEATIKAAKETIEKNTAEAEKTETNTEALKKQLEEQDGECKTLQNQLDTQKVIEKGIVDEIETIESANKAKINEALGELKQWEEKIAEDEKLIQAEKANLEVKKKEIEKRNTVEQLKNQTSQYHADASTLESVLSDYHDHILKMTNLIDLASLQHNDTMTQFENKTIAKTEEIAKIKEQKSLDMKNAEEEVKSLQTKETQLDEQIKILTDLINSIQSGQLKPSVNSLTPSEKAAYDAIEKTQKVNEKGFGDIEGAQKALTDRVESGGNDNFQSKELPKDQPDTSIKESGVNPTEVQRSTTPERKVEPKRPNPFKDNFITNTKSEGTLLTESKSKENIGYKAVDTTPVKNVLVDKNIASLEKKLGEGKQNAFKSKLTRSCSGLNAQQNINLQPSGTAQGTSSLRGEVVIGDIANVDKKLEGTAFSSFTDCEGFIACLMKLYNDTEIDSLLCKLQRDYDKYNANKNSNPKETINCLLERVGSNLGIDQSDNNRGNASEAKTEKEK
ncbi:hypothetical protein EIN_369490 [Entamoeba invadens IP1]|uniref:Uncharacterized protein n=1 Tax=Entamoeba invadens IP1 TaxID=370355 RepID=A0A0A1UGF7_ENTIV|nr:hypothetical protein EIN_369490 [Entamoeba invadens IP1]ELP92627.1 hypothetical protein EIN_369490 [Entamoeba invadens IP1]|eukprot:XP_004259398.1 hypothetical protein EIN_369490 [Entamoeba invadens IP1]